MARPLRIFWVALCISAAAAVPGQGIATVRAASEEFAQLRPGLAPPSQVKALAAGKLLVASRGLRDPNFAERVVLLTDYDKNGAAGLVINVRTDVRLSRAFEHLSLGANAMQTVFAGGPVSPASAVVLMRSRPGMTGVRTVAPGVDVISTRERLEQTLTSETEPDRFRVYLGRAGWGPGQLEREAQLGAWHVFAADVDSVFDLEPATLWRRLIRRTELQMARISSIP
jgi:putative transcriptional regulator